MRPVFLDLRHQAWPLLWVTPHPAKENHHPPQTLANTGWVVHSPPPGSLQDPPDAGPPRQIQEHDYVGPGDPNVEVGAAPVDYPGVAVSKLLLESPERRTVESVCRDGLRSDDAVMAVLPPEAIKVEDLKAKPFPQSARQCRLARSDASDKGDPPRLRKGGPRPAGPGRRRSFARFAAGLAGGKLFCAMAWVLVSPHHFEASECHAWCGLSCRRRVSSSPCAAASAALSSLTSLWC